MRLELTFVGAGRSGNMLQSGVPAARLAGLLCTGSSPLSHGVIVARALGIPAVIGVAGLIPDHCSGREIILDGYRGRIVLDPTPEVRAEFQRFEHEESELKNRLEGLRNLPSRTPNGRHVSLEANITLLDEIRTAKEQGVAGVGLYRSEFPFLLRDTLPGEDTQYAIYRELLAARVMAVDGQAEQLAVDRLEVGVALGECDELGGANRRKVCRVREEHQPLASVVLQLTEERRMLNISSWDELSGVVSLGRSQDLAGSMCR